MSNTNPESYKAVAVAMASHPSLDHGDDSGWHDLECTIPADFTGAFDHDDFSTSVFFDYAFYEDDVEILSIEQEIDLDDVAILLSFNNGIETVGYSVNDGSNELSVRYDGSRIMSFTATVNGKTIEFKRDLSHADGVAPVFIPA